MKGNGRIKLVSAVVISIFTSTSPIFAQDPAASVVFPVVAELFVDEPFRACEGIAFNGEGRMFATCNLGFWEIRPDGSSYKLAELQSNLGVAGIGKRDLLVADFGASAAFGKGGRNTDGVILRFTPEGAMARLDTASAIPISSWSGQTARFSSPMTRRPTSISCNRMARRNSTARRSIIPTAWCYRRMALLCMSRRRSPIYGPSCSTIPCGRFD